MAEKKSTRALCKWLWSHFHDHLTCSGGNRLPLGSHAKQTAWKHGGEHRTGYLHDEQRTASRSMRQWRRATAPPFPKKSQPGFSSWSDAPLVSPSSRITILTSKNRLLTPERGERFAFLHVLGVRGFFSKQIIRSFSKFDTSVSLLGEMFCSDDFYNIMYLIKLVRWLEERWVWENMTSIRSIETSETS